KLFFGHGFEKSSTCARHGVREVIRLSARRNSRSRVSDGGPGVGSRWPSDPEISSDLLETVDDFRVQRDPFLSELLHAREALLSMHIDSLLSQRPRAVFQLASESIHIP